VVSGGADKPVSNGDAAVGLGARRRLAEVLGRMGMRFQRGRRPGCPGPALPFLCSVAASREDYGRPAVPTIVEWEVSASLLEAPGVAFVTQPDSGREDGKSVEGGTQQAPEVRPIECPLVSRNSLTAQSESDAFPPYPPSTSS